MTIDIKELRRLTQAATPGPWINYGRQPNAPGVPHSAVAAKTLLARVYSEAYGDFRQETANANLIAAANPAAISELLDRLEAAERDRATFITEIGDLCTKVEAAEKEIALKERVIDALGSELNAVAKERDALRAKVEATEKQEPVAWLHETRRDSDVVTDAVKHVWGKAVVGAMAAYSIPLYTSPGAKGEEK